MTRLLSPLRARPAGAIILAAICAACSRSPDPGNRLVTTLPETFHRGSLVISADGKRYAYVDSAPAGERVVASGYVGPLHPRCGRPRFAPKTNALFYWAADYVEGVPKVFFVTPETVVPMESSEPGALVFSPDGTRWAMLESANGATGDGGESEAGAVVYVDGSEIGRWAHASLPSFSPDGKHVAFVYEDADRNGAVMVDGERLRPIDALDGPCAAALDSATGSYVSVLSARYVTDGRLLVVGRDRDEFTVDLDGERLASYPNTEREGGSGFVIALSEECRVRPAIAPRSFRLAEAAPVAAWWERVAGDQEHWRVVLNGKPVDEVLCDDVWEDEPPQISVDGRATAYACIMHHQASFDDIFVVTPGGRRHGPYRAIWGISFSDDAKRVTWGASNGDADRAWSIFVDGEPLVARFQAVFRPRFTPDGKRVVWEAQRSRRGRSLLGIGTRPLASFDDVYWGPEFPARDRVEWIVRRKDRLVRVVADID